MRCSSSYNNSAFTFVQFSKPTAFCNPDWEYIEMNTSFVYAHAGGRVAVILQGTVIFVSQVLHFLSLVDHGLERILSNPLQTG